MIDVKCLRTIDKYVFGAVTLAVGPLVKAFSRGGMPPAPRKVLLITTCGADQAHMEQSGIQKAIQMTTDVGIFAFTGIPEIRHEFFYNVVQTDQSTREQFLKRAFALGADY